MLTVSCFTNVWANIDKLRGHLLSVFFLGVVFSCKRFMITAKIHDYSRRYDTVPDSYSLGDFT